ncbi:uncharacterized protein LOC131604680 [Vicia villosa]|uniref:uncharacterized protein LOC131604680 n=1 Tax=Vicia villosa TaxID=3911 RepID=UPI00273C6FCD|nr:uncharacterized protein LOC131604680 [Vicia villosa]
MENQDISVHIVRSRSKLNLERKCFLYQELIIPNADMLIKDICFINSIPLITIVDTGATHFFIVTDCVKRFFGVNLICLPLRDLDVILGINWLEFNHVHIICYNKYVRFVFPIEEEEMGLLSARKMEEVLQDEAQVFALFAYLSAESQAVIDEFSIVHDFLDVFLDDVSDVPPKREVEFFIDLVPGTRHVSMVPYMMSTSEFEELRKKLEDLLENKFVRPSVSPCGAPMLLVKKDGSMRLCVDY